MSNVFLRSVGVGLLTGVAWLAGATAPAEAHEFPDAWFWTEGDAEAKASHEALEGQPMPPLPVSEWRNGELDAESMKGQIIVVDFWATWCGPCISAMPHNNEVFNTYKDQGVIVLGICGSKNGQDKFDAVLEKQKVVYPNARDTTFEAAKAWNVRWWPTYAVVDRHGVVRASGLKPNHVEDVLEKLLAEQPAEQASQPKAEDQAAAPSIMWSASPAPGSNASLAQAQATPSPRSAVADAAALPAEWLEGDAALRARLQDLNADDAPQWDLSNWMHHAPVNRADLEGKVVVLDFWATWCGPCISSIPKLNALSAKYADDGLVVIGVCHPRGAEKMGQVVEQHGIAYPVAADADGQTIADYRVNGYPDYYVFDRAGRLRGADVKNKHVEDAVKMLLAEPAPAPGEAR